MIEDSKIITEYRDKMNIARLNILNNFAMEHLDNPNLMYIYSVNSNDNNIFNLCYCDKTKSHEIIEINKEELPEGAEIGSIVLNNKGQYIIDEEATKEIAKQLGILYRDIMKQQNEYLSSKRIDGHKYEVYEIAEDRVWLFDITENNDESFEEIIIPKNMMETLKEGDMLEYTNENYVTS